MEKRFLTVRELSGFLNLSSHFLYKLISQKAIPYTKIGKKILFDLRKIESWIEERSIKPVDDWREKLNL